MASANLRGAAFGLAAMGTYATHDAVIKALGSRYAPVQIMFFVALLSLPLLARAALARGGGSLRPVNPGWVALRSVAQAIGVLCAITAFAALPMAQVYAILFTLPLIVTLLAIPILGEPVGIHRWGAIICGLVGVLIVVRPTQGALSLGHLAAAMSAAMGALSAVIARRIGRTESTLVMVMGPVLLNLIVTAALLPLVYQPMPLGDLGLAGLIGFLALGGAGLSVMSYRLGEATVVAPMQYSQILWAAGYGWFIFGEAPDRATWIGVSVIVASGLYILWRETRVSARRPVLASGQSGDTLPSPRPAPFIRLLRRRRIH